MTNKLEILPADETITVRNHSSIDQYKGFLSVMTKGGYTPIQFDSLDGINCNQIKSRPIIISYGDIGYHYQDAECTYLSDLYVLFDREGVELVPLNECQGGKGEFYERYYRTRSFVNVDGGDSYGNSLGTRNEITLRVGLNYIVADEKLPYVD